MPDVVPVSVRRDRSNALRILSQKKKAAHYVKHLGETRNVLFEKKPDEKNLSGFTDNYIRIVLENSSSDTNTIQPVLLREIVTISDDIFAAAVMT